MTLRSVDNSMYDKPGIRKLLEEENINVTFINITSRYGVMYNALCLALTCRQTHNLPMNHYLPMLLGPSLSWSLDSWIYNQAITTYHHYSSEFEFRSWHGVLATSHLPAQIIEPDEKPRVNLSTLEGSLLH